MSTTLAAVAPLSTGAQTAVHIPVILLALAGAVLALVFTRRLGLPAALLMAIGSAVVAADQIVNVIWTYVTFALAKDDKVTADQFTGTQNTFAIVDAVLITIGIGLLVVGLVLVRRAPGATPPSFASGSYPPQAYPGQPYAAQPYPPQSYAQQPYPAPGYGTPASTPPPGSAPPWSGSPGAESHGTASSGPAPSGAE